MKNKLVMFFVCAMLLSSSITILTNANSMKISDDNNPPNSPEIVGPASGKIHTAYLYNITLSDPDVYDGLLRLEIDFGEGIITILPGCCGKVWANPTTINVTYEWENSGNYNITGRVMDTNGNWSNWSEPLSVTMPLDLQISHSNSQQISQQSSNHLLLKMVQRLLLNKR